MQADRVLAAAFAEMRSARRLVRTWMFTAVALIIGLVGYLQQVVFHAIGSGLSVTIGAMMAPRFVIAQLGGQMLWVLMIALVFLAFDIRARDKRERMDEVLDARPVGNFSMLLGRLVGLILVGWLPLAFIALFSLGLTGLANAAGWWISPGIEPVSMAALLFVDVPVTLALWGALVIFTAIVVPNRLFAAIVGLGLFGLYLAAFFMTPVYLLGGIIAIGDPAQTPSDLAPIFLSWPGLLHRFAFLALAVGLLAFAAALHPRPDGAGRGKRLVAGAALTALGAGGIAGLTMSAIAGVAERAAWTAIHTAAKDVPRADLTTLSGSVVIDPGRGLTLDIEATLKAPTVAAETLVFAFNPGLAVRELQLDGEPAEFRHESGLLTIRPAAPMSAAQPFTLAMRADGVPDARFGYLDGAYDPLMLSGIEYGAAYLLGTLPALFDEDYVALMPGIRWLPTPGANVGLDETDRGRDFFLIDLEVETPVGWMAAGPGRREPRPSTAETVRVRFNPGAPVPEVGVFAAPFERMAMEVDGVSLELLVSPEHADNLRFFADAREALQRHIRDVFGSAANVGLGYPYSGFSLVEVPYGIRSYGGGWRMDTALALPGIMLLPEAGLPLAQFGFHFRNPERFEGQEGGIAEAKVDALAASLQNDFGGGNPFLGASRNFLLYQTGATGRGAAALDFLLEHLANLLITEREGYFSAHGVQAQLQSAMGTAMLSLFAADTGSVTATIRNAATNRPAVWDRALGEPLADLDTATQPELALNALVLKTSAVSHSIMESLGWERTGALLAELRRRYQGRNFTAADLEALAVELGSDLRPIVGDWLNETALPGFLTSDVQAFRLPDLDSGRPQYQVLVHVRNDEPAPGVFRLSSRVSAEGERASRGTETIRIDPVSSLEVGLTTTEKPQALTLAFHIALNRENVPLRLPEIDEEDVRDAEPFNGHRPSDWRPPVSTSLVIDDLDAGFSVVYDDGEAPAIGGGIAISLGAVPAPDLDEGLPQHSPFTTGGGTWSRQQLPGAWGKYRHTLARAGTANRNATATFAAELPNTGRWRLEYHLPQSGGGNNVEFDTSAARAVRVQVVFSGGGNIGEQGEYDMTLVVGEEQRAIEFDGSVAEPGWNRLGDFDIASRNVKLVVSNLATRGNTVVADAVRWTPLP